MRKIIVGGLFFFMLAASSLVSAAEMKLGFVDVTVIADKLDMQAKVEKKLKSEFADRQEEIAGKVNTYKKKAEKYQQDMDLMDDAAKTKAERELANLQRDIQRMQVELQEDATGRQQAETKKFLDILNSAVTDAAKKQGYTLVLHKNTALLVDDNMDITLSVLDIMKNTGKV